MKQAHKRKNKKAKIKKGPADRFALPAWLDEGLGGSSTQEILDDLRNEGLPLDEDMFQLDAGKVSDPGELAHLWVLRVDRGPGRWEDYFQLAARELWKRLLPDRDHFECFFDDWEVYMEKLKEGPPGKRTEADIPELLKLLDRLDSLLKAMSHEKGINLHDCLMEVANLYNHGLLDWLIELPFEFAGDGFVNQAVDVSRRFFYISPATLLGDLGVILAEAGRFTEADEQIAENLKNFPEDPWVIIKAGDSMELCEKIDQAEKLYLQALEMTSDRYTREGAIQRLIPLYEQLGKSRELEELKKRYPPDPIYEEIMEVSEQTTDRDNSTDKVTPIRTKIGRNDPCPCGSGKKYKKCCLLKNVG